jgi:cytoskeleton protein RodZ
MSTLPGKILREKRLELGLSYEKVAEKTLIRVPILNALEDDDYSSMSSETQVRGFIRNYAQFLNIDLSELLPDVKPQSQDRKLTVEQLPEQQPLIEKTMLVLDQPDPFMKATPKVLDSDPDSKSPVPLDTVVPRSQKYFEEIGAQLLERRSLLSFSLSNVEDNIHVKKEYLSALEDGDLSLLPSSVQAKGILQIYARFLDLDVDKIMLHFAEGLQQRRLESSNLITEKQRFRKPISPMVLTLKKFFTLDLFFGSILIIGMLVFLIWSTSQLIKTSQEVGFDPTLPEVADVLNATNQSFLAIEQTPAAEETSINVTEMAVTNTLILPMDSYNSPVQILVIPNQDVWIRIMIDGEITFEGRLESGDAKTYSADKTIFLTCANAAAVRIYFKGVDLGDLGPLGKVITLSFDNTGLIKPLTTPTPTPTTTSIGTSTSQVEQSTPAP